jgi:hypothetical protein
MVAPSAAGENTPARILLGLTSFATLTPPEHYFKAVARWDGTFFLETPQLRFAYLRFFRDGTREPNGTMDQDRIKR